MIPVRPARGARRVRQACHRAVGAALAVAGLAPAAAANHLPHNIPHFCAAPTIRSVASGSWSNPAIWSPARVPATNDAVSVSAGTTVTYDRASDESLTCVGIDGGLVFAPNVNTRIKVGTLMVMQTGLLQIGKAGAPIAAAATAEIVIANRPLDTTTDPEQYGTGLVAFGKVEMHGAVRAPTFTRLTVEPLAAVSTLTTADTLTGWRPGDRLILPDTRHLNYNEFGSSYVPQWEELTLVAANGQQIGLSSPLRYAHRGARDVDGTLEFLPHVGNLTRNVIIRSESPTGTRGHTLFTARADIDIRYVLFRSLGRTTLAPLHNTTFDSTGQVTQIGTNQIGRYAVHMHHLMGPSAAPANGYQYTFVGNAVEDAFKWGVAIHNTHYGLVRDNVIYNAGGAELMTEDGSESFNVIEHNFAVRSFGTGGRQGLGREGVGFYFRGPNNYVRGNVAANIQSDALDAAYGFKYFLEYLGNIRVPNFPGADTSVAGQYTTRDGNALALLEFTDNEVYGATESGLTFWWVGTFGAYFPRSDAGRSTIRNFRVWHAFNRGVFNYDSNRVTIDRLVVRGAYTALSACCGLGVDMVDYYQKDFILQNADIQGMATGVYVTSIADGPLQIVDSYLRNHVNVQLPMLWSSSGTTSHIPPRRVVMNRVRLVTPPVETGVSQRAIWMDYRGGSRNLIQANELIVYSHNGVSGDDFRVYYQEQAPGYIVPQTVLNADGAATILGAPVSGLTNTQTWSAYRIAIAGAVAPCATTRSLIHGFVCTGSLPPPTGSVAAPTNLRILR